VAAVARGGAGGGIEDKQDGAAAQPLLPRTVRRSVLEPQADFRCEIIERRSAQPCAGVIRQGFPECVRFPTLPRSASEPESSIKALHARRKFTFVQLKLNGKAAICGAFAEPSSGLEPETPSLPWNVSGNWWQPVERIWLVPAGFAAWRFAADCQWLRLLGSINAPSL
jgi:hypothetical protein